MRFADVGVSLQMSSQSSWELEGRFHRSCEICALHGIPLECDRCPIRAANSVMKEILHEVFLASCDDKENHV